MELVLLSQSGTVSAAGDPVHQAAVEIDPIHALVHLGKLFDVGVKTADGADLVDDASLDLLIRPQGAEFHMVGAVAVGGNAEVFFYEDTEVTGGTAYGTALTPVNKKRVSDNVMTTLFYESPTISDVGNLIESDNVPGGSKPFAIGASIRSGAEWELHTTKLYLIRVYNRSGSAALAGISLEGYEE